MSSILNNPVLGPLIKTSVVRKYAKGQTILYPDDKQPYLYFIKSGAVMMHDIDDQGNRKILYIFGPPTLFPMVSFLESTVQSSWFYATVVDSELAIISHDELRERMQDNEDGAYNALLRQMPKEVHELLLHITDHVKTDSVEKVISIMRVFVNLLPFWNKI